MPVADPTKFVCRQCGNITEKKRRSAKSKFCSPSCRSKHTADKFWREHAVSEDVQHLRDVERFWKKCRMLEVDDCWMWLSGLFSNGYGQFWKKSGSIPAHRFAWQVSHGREAPKDLHVCHTCDNPLCVNPAHLFLGTALDNKLDCVSKGRHARGEKVNPATLTDEQVLQVREGYENGSTIKHLARKFKTSQGAISGVINRKTWRHI